jgi:hypothetical protein
MRSGKRASIHLLVTILADLFFLGVLTHYGLDGWRNALELMAAFGPWGWLLLAVVLFLLLYGSDYRLDLPLFAAGWALGYWGEWWGTTRGVWSYWNGATPPNYLPPLWGLGLITAYHLSALFAPLFERPTPRWARVGMIASFFALPLAALGRSWPLLATVNWRGRLDAHFFAGLAIAAALIRYRFDLRRAFPLYMCGMALGGLYEYLGTISGEWTYITGETPPLWIAPLWGLAAVAMSNLAQWLRQGLSQVIQRLYARRLRPAALL